MVEPEAMEVISSAPLPDEALVTVDTALPSRVFPSDHVSIVADLRFKEQPQIGTK